MKLYKIFIISLVLISFFGCGSNTDKLSTPEQLLNSQREQTSMQKEKTQDKSFSEDENNKYQQDEEVDEESYTQDANSIMIIDSSISYAPNIILHDNSPSGAYYRYQEDPKRGYLLAIYTNGIKNSFYILGYDVTQKYQWNEIPSYQNILHISWDSKFSEDFIIFIVVVFKDENGNKIYRDLVYTPTPNGYPNYTNDFMHISLGKNAKDGKWHHYDRNILADIREFYPNATILNGAGYVNGFAIRGTGKITNLKLSK